VAISNYKGVGGQNWGWGSGLWNPVPAVGVNNGSTNGLEAGDGILPRSDGSSATGVNSGGSIHKYTFLSVTDGTSNTFMIGESLPNLCLWTGAWAYSNNVTGTCAIYPNAPTTTGTNWASNDWPDCYSFHSQHTGGLQFCMVDGSVHFVTSNVAINVYRALATIQGQEPVGLPNQ
jgi:hypothetical protein